MIVFSIGGKFFHILITSTRNGLFTSNKLIILDSDLYYKRDVRELKTKIANTNIKYLSMIVFYEIFSYIGLVRISEFHEL